MHDDRHLVYPCIGEGAEPRVASANWKKPWVGAPPAVTPLLPSSTAIAAAAKDMPATTVDEASEKTADGIQPAAVNAESSTAAVTEERKESSSSYEGTDEEDLSENNPSKKKSTNKKKKILASSPSSDSADFASADGDTGEVEDETKKNDRSGGGDGDNLIDTPAANPTASVDGLALLQAAIFGSSPSPQHNASSSNMTKSKKNQSDHTATAAAVMEEEDNSEEYFSCNSNNVSMNGGVNNLLEGGGDDNGDFYDSDAENRDIVTNQQQPRKKRRQNDIDEIPLIEVDDIPPEKKKKLNALYTKLKTEVVEQGLQLLSVRTNVALSARRFTQGVMEILDGGLPNVNLQGCVVSLMANISKLIFQNAFLKLHLIVFVYT